MKIRSLSILLIAISFIARAGNSDLEMHCAPKLLKQENKPAADGGAAETKENWAYDVTIENKTFKDLPNLEVKYVIFYSQEKLGTKAAADAKRQSGSLPLAVLKPHEKKMLTTDAVELTKAHLVGNWIYTAGAKPNANGALAGLWVRVYQNGQLFAEYANPSTLLTQQKWE